MFDTLHPMFVSLHTMLSTFHMVQTILWVIHVAHHLRNFGAVKSWIFTIVRHGWPLAAL
jgi:hypothetical protein